MILTDFGKWLEYHFARFPDTAAWFAKFPEESAGVGDPSRDAVIQSWADLFKDVDLADARRGTDAIFAGDEDKPRTPEDTAKVIRKLAWAARRKRPKKKQTVDGQEVFRCALCEDRGIVVVYTRRTVERFRAGQLVRGSRLTADGRRGIETGTTPCECTKGARHWMLDEDYGGMQYTAKFMCLVTAMAPDDQFDELAAWDHAHPRRNATGAF